MVFRLSLILVAPWLLLAGCGKEPIPSEQSAEPMARPAKIVPLTRNGVSMLRTYPGTLEATKKANLAFRVSGQLQELPAVPGLRVRAGDLLARLDPKDFETQVAERRARFDLAKTQQDQTSKLFKKKLSSQLAYDQANAELKSARAALQLAQDNLRYSLLKAPFDGVVARVDIKNYQPVQAQVPIIQLQRVDELDIHFSVPESLFSQLRPLEDPDSIRDFCGRVSFVSHPDKHYRACYKEHESTPDPVTRNYAGRFTLEPIKDFIALPGMTASIELDFSPYIFKQAESSLFAPVEAVFAEAGKQWLWQVDEGMTARKVEVTLGRIEGGLVEITSEIDPQKSVIAAGVSYVREGMRVKPMIKQRGL